MLKMSVIKYFVYWLWIFSINYLYICETKVYIKSVYIEVIFYE